MAAIPLDLESLWDELEETLLPLYVRFRTNLQSLRVETKDDGTLLSAADHAIQSAIVSTIRRADTDAQILAEEAGLRPKYLAARPTATWVVDPIDGTREFLSEAGKEFCSVVAVVAKGRPIAALVFAPEFGPGRTPLTVRVGPGSLVLVNGDRAETPMSHDIARISATRSATSAPRRFETKLSANGHLVKLRTTSQTLDMVRASIELSAAGLLDAESFDIFFRRNQKVWDGAAGLCLAEAMGRRACDEYGRPVMPLSLPALSGNNDEIPSTIVGDPAAVEWFLSELELERAS